jgi:RimJ/RimL family protein N-acetyltransferase
MLGPAYRVETPRLVLRCYDPRDAPWVKAAVDANLEHLAGMHWVRSEPQTLEDKVQLLRGYRAAFDAGKDFAYGIFDRGEKELLGSCGLHPRVGDRATEVGYWIHAAHVRQGLAAEAAGALTRVAFEIDRLERVEIHCGPANAASAGVARKLGYTHEATLRGRAREPDGRPRDTMIWSLFAADYPRSPAAQVPLTAYDALNRPLALAATPGVASP